MCVCVWRGVNVSTSQAETITSVGCLFLTHWTNLIEAKHLKSSGNVTDPPPVQFIQTTTPLQKPAVVCGFIYLLSSPALFLKIGFRASSLFSNDQWANRKIIHLCSLKSLSKKPVFLSTGQQLCTFLNNK